jgi:hypothetical protein
MQPDVLLFASLSRGPYSSEITENDERALGHAILRAQSSR